MYVFFKGGKVPEFLFFFLVLHTEYGSRKTRLCFSLRPYVVQSYLDSSVTHPTLSFLLRRYHSFDCASAVYRVLGLRTALPLSESVMFLLEIALYVGVGDRGFVLW